MRLSCSPELGDYNVPNFIIIRLDLIEIFIYLFIDHGLTFGSHVTLVTWSGGDPVFPDQIPSRNSPRGNPAILGNPVFNL
jgi:hypothetical protein